MIEKKCWSCEARTAYNQGKFLETGWCPSCREKIPQDIYDALAAATTEPYAGQMRLVVADLIKVTNTRKAASLYLVPKSKPGKPKIDLDELEI